MIEFFEVENYRCFRNAKVRLGPLTVLVGPNATGKTSLLRALTEARARGAIDTWQHTSGLPMSFRWSRTGDEVGRLDVVDGKESGFRINGQYIHLDVRKLRAKQTVQEAERLAEDGGNLVNVVATISRRAQGQLAEELAQLVPVLRDMAAKPATPGEHRLVFQDRWNEQVWYEPTEVSDGTLLALGLLSLRYQTYPPAIIGIEEPEHGLHPYLLGNVVTMFRKLAQGETGRPALQIVVATQSAELLEFLEPSEVRFLSRSSLDGSVSIEEAPTDTETWRDAYEAHQRSLGSLWLSGSLGGIPTG